ncbi:MAG: PEGA domain-containing protein, partial [Fibromonadales bacterium]|nr:PEGA domain-containing protein [Fibromonadales bacterium]
GGNYSITMELYHIRGNLIGSFNGNAKDVFGLVAVINEKAPQMFSKMPGASAASKTAPSAPSVASGISGVQSTGGDYEFEGGKSYLASIATEPEGAIVSFNGVPDSRCAKTPCKLTLAEGNVRIVAALDQYERADTTVFVKQNNQSISIKLKANFGVLEIKPAFLDGIGEYEDWKLYINGKAYTSFENRLSPGKYNVKLNHICYEVISFDAGINKDKHEVFYMSDHIKLRKGGLVLNAERNGEPVSEPVFVNSKQAGETPFSGSVPVCAEIELGKVREKVDVKLKPNEKVEHTVKSNIYKSSISTTPTVSVAPPASSLKDSRDNKTYKIVKIGNQTWMAENLNYNASGSECYGNKESNCQKYGRLYKWETAKSVCPNGWHLSNDAEWTMLINFVGTKAGTKLKAKSGWNSNGNGMDTYGFAALPGGYGGSGGGFSDIGSSGFWWNILENYASYRSIDYNNDNVFKYDNNGYPLRSVRCVQD